MKFTYDLYQNAFHHSYPSPVTYCHCIIYWDGNPNAWHIQRATACLLVFLWDKVAVYFRRNRSCRYIFLTMLLSIWILLVSQFRLEKIYLLPDIHLFRINGKFRKFSLPLNYASNNHHWRWACRSGIICALWHSLVHFCLAGRYFRILFFPQKVTYSSKFFFVEAN